MDRSNPYESAFEGYLQKQNLCYVAVDEGRRSMLGDTPVKNLDFIVLGANGRRLLVDVKGRRFPGGTPDKPKYTWENWATSEDLDGFRAWTEVFGPNYLAMFVFIYRIGPNVELPTPCVDLWTFREQTYLLRCVAFEDYLIHMKTRSPKWGTVHLPSAVYRDLARPFRYFSHVLKNSEEHVDGSNFDRIVPEFARFAVAQGGEPADSLAGSGF